MFKKDRLKKLVAILTSVIYIHVNVVWAADPAAPVGEQIRSAVDQLPSVVEQRGILGAAAWTFRAVFLHDVGDVARKASRAVYVFHFDDNPQLPPELPPPPADRPRPRGPDGPGAMVERNVLMTPQQARARGMSDGDIAAVRAAYRANGNNAVRVNVFRNADGQLGLQLANRPGAGRNAANNNNAPNQPLTPRQQAQQRQNQAMDRRLEGNVVGRGVVTINGQQIRVRRDENGRIVARDPNQQIVVQARDAAGNARQMPLTNLQFEVQNGQLVVKGEGQLAAGQRFNDGRVGEAGGAAGNGQNAGGPQSRNLNVYVANDGQISFEAKAGGGQVAVTAVVDQGGTARVDHKSFQPVTAGSENIDIYGSARPAPGEAPIATVRAAQVVNGAGGQQFRYSQWTVPPGAENRVANGARILEHFGVSRDSAALVNSAGQTVGRVGFNNDHNLSSMVFLNNTAGRAAMNSVYFQNRAAFAAGGVYS